MSAPAFSRERTIVPRKPAPAASPGPCAALSVESPRLPFFDGSTHKASPPANWFNRAHQSAAAKRRSAGPSASSHRAGSRRVTGRTGRCAAEVLEQALRRTRAAGVGFVQQLRATTRQTVARAPLGLRHRRAQLVHHESASGSTRNSPSLPMLRMVPPRRALACRLNAARCI